MFLPVKNIFTTYKLYIYAGILIVVTGTLIFSHYKIYSVGVQKTTNFYEKKLIKEIQHQQALLKKQEEDQMQLIAVLNSRLQKAEKAATKIKTVEVVKYVTKKANDMCIITSGFKQLFDMSANPQIPTSAPFNVDTQTPIKISDVASVTAGNFGECYERGEIITAWQTWYTESKNIFDKLK